MSNNSQGMGGMFADLHRERVAKSAAAERPVPQHEFDPGYSGMSVRCNALVLRDGAGDDCGRPASDPIHAGVSA